MKAEKEADVLRQCLDYLRIRNVFCFRVNNTGIFDPARKRFRSFHGMRGCADILGILPMKALPVSDESCPTFGLFLAIEVKGPKGKLSPDQEWFLEEVRRQGGVAIVARSLRDLEDALKQEGY
jgi:hypothetical protein